MTQVVAPTEIPGAPVARRHIAARVIEAAAVPLAACVAWPVVSALASLEMSRSLRADYQPSVAALALTAAGWVILLGSMVALGFCIRRPVRGVTDVITCVVAFGVIVASLVLVWVYLGNLLMFPYLGTGTFLTTGLLVLFYVGLLVARLVAVSRLARMRATPEPPEMVVRDTTKYEPPAGSGGDDMVWLRA